MIDPSQYKDYILTMLFIKYISDVWKDKKEEYSKKDYDYLLEGDFSAVKNLPKTFPKKNWLPSMKNWLPSMNG